jgi:Tol biopolymer transport system component
MPGKPKSRWIATAVVAAALVASPAAAQATLVFTRNPLNSTVWVANDNGSGARKLTKGRDPHVSPDGQLVAYERVTKSHGFRPELMLASASGKSPPQLLLDNWTEPAYSDWSPDSSTFVALAGGGTKSRQLVAIDLATGTKRTIAKGFFAGVSFSPGGEELVYAKAGSEKYPPRSDIYRASLATGKSVRLTKNHNSLLPLWGPNGAIVFVKLLHAKQRRYGPESQLFLMSEEGGHVRRLTHTKVAPLLSGLAPTAWSANGKRLLAEFNGQDTSYAVVVNPKTGAERALTKEREVGFVGTALSSDGSTVLGAVGEFEGNIPGRKVLGIPYGGGKPKVLAKNASEPDWSR